MLVLASSSPRRRQILAAAGIAHTVRPAEVDESPRDGETPESYVERLALAKARAAAAAPGDIVLGADTVVVIDGQILGKPAAGRRDATRMLEALSGREHRVLTGVCLLNGTRVAQAIETTRVRFVPLAPEEIDAYVASGEPMDKAGAYAVQGLASKFIDRIEGCYFNVVGLPIARVYALLKAFDGCAGSPGDPARAG